MTGMTGFYALVVICLLATVVAGLVRVIGGPTRVDRMLAAQLFGTSGVALILLIAHIEEVEGLVDVALVLSLLTVLAAVAFVRRAWE
ncbi:monovalent cation/H+ antiporter complex subunit F [Persicimonas caeni]|jgi:multicomponent Na+:H+ antiporter subunit F|nr:monovalent cation/H+ antiporter complex subunit F [Persicimonas caeni]